MEIIITAMSNHSQYMYSSLVCLLITCYIAGAILGTRNTKEGQARLPWLTEPTVLGVGFRHSAVRASTGCLGAREASPTHVWRLRGRASWKEGYHRGNLRCDEIYPREAGWVRGMSEGEEPAPEETPSWGKGRETECVSSTSVR